MAVQPDISSPRATALAEIRPIRVAHVLHTMAHGGVETAILNWVTTTDPKRFDIKLICFKNPGGTEAAFLESAKAFGIYPELVPWSRWKPILQSALALVKILRKHRIEIIHCHNTYANLVGLLAARVYPIKTVTTMYVWGDLGSIRNVLQWVDTKIMRSFDIVSAHCEEALRGTVERGIPASKIPLLICGYPKSRIDLSEDTRTELRSSLGVGPEDIALLYLARFWPEKAHDNLLDAFARMRQRGAKVILWLPGDGPDLQRIQELAHAKGLDDTVRFPGFRRDFEHLLAACDIQVHPSDAEGVSLAICAGMSAGVPIVASHVGGLKEVLRNGHSAVLIPPRSPELLADSILDLIAHPAKARLLGENARQFIENEYSIEAATAKVERVYEALMRA
jgi:glycosyltransferase involved in cell wall biosynthesis